ncbi:hypothetical protein OFB74_33065, partial [Escherichia coli]|nr:hypothetical protein [Escherichia coli]
PLPLKATSRTKNSKNNTGQGRVSLLIIVEILHYYAYSDSIFELLERLSISFGHLNSQLFLKKINGCGLFFAPDTVL